jgi:3-oxoacyl-[acyl-carrier-protein] synthase-3
MYINSIGHYIPSQRVDNAYFEKILGFNDEWFASHTGMRTRSKAGKDENNHTMGLMAIEAALPSLPYLITDVDLIIHASYTPLDTVGTFAHVAQQKYNMEKAKAFHITSACSTFVNALEIAQAFFATGKASKALIVASEHNTMYNDETNEKEAKIVDVFSKGLGHIGKGPEGVYLRPKTEGLTMPFGRDVFLHACGQMIDALSNILSNNDLKMSDLNYIIPHQANKRIISNIAKQLQLDLDRFPGNIEYLGNTGCASTPIVLSEQWNTFNKGELISITVFGGGYSSGSFLVRK